MQPTSRAQRGAVAVEFALIFPMFLLIIVAYLAMGIGVLTRMNALNASELGGRYSTCITETGRPLPTSDCENFIRAKLVVPGGGGVVVNCVDDQVPFAHPALQYRYVTVTYNQSWLMNGLVKGSPTSGVFTLKANTEYSFQYLPDSMRN